MRVGVIAVKRRQSETVLLMTPKQSGVQVELVGLVGTCVFLRAKTKENALTMFEALIESPSVISASLYVRGRFQGARDGAGS